MESISQNEEKFGKFISMLEEYEEYRAVHGILARRLEGMSGASGPPGENITLLPTGSDRRGVLGAGSIPLAILPYH